MCSFLILHFISFYKYFARKLRYDNSKNEIVVYELEFVANF